MAVANWFWAVAKLRATPMEVKPELVKDMGSFPRHRDGRRLKLLIDKTKGLSEICMRKL
jgi:hypothetical protein